MRWRPSGPGHRTKRIKGVALPLAASLTTSSPSKILLEATSYGFIWLI